ncbi:hypothetical protein FA15DRAFT_633314 [Coprinopsis marcescibilis]|uniref:Phospholipid/glycerol acyltransferase domain-containing protein n=1 Tax=Coprinopsis marcescibilis TaxID=230819 RepID=A0A5C3L7V1_COPMA|nr:hypothetical protein FA15DRAFT_633314 [Coprinopsis marcescibilis]
MEKFSAYRDAGTGIQPFLTPVPPATSDILAKLSLPIRYALALVRTALILALSLVYLILVHGVGLLLAPIPPLYNLVTHLLTFILGRSALLVLGLFWIPVEYTSRKRGKKIQDISGWNPKAGDLIVSNWSSWVEVVWLAIRFNPIFVLPIPEKEIIKPASTQGSPIGYKPGRRTGTGSANIEQAARTTSPRVPIAGFKQVSMWSMIASTGYAPSRNTLETTQTLEDIRKAAGRPIVVFPECTTSNGRGLLRFADVFGLSVPVKNFNVFVLSVRYDPPTPLTPTLSHSIPSNFLNPLPHLFGLTTSLVPLTISIRLLPLSESPSSRLFVASEVLAGNPDEDQLAESCAAIIAQIGKLKRTGMGWEDKSSLLDLHYNRAK